MKNLPLYIILAYFAIMVQALFFGNTKPDFILVLVCFFAIRNGMKQSMFYGTFSGLLLDLTSGFMIGPNMISKSIATFLTKTIRDNLLEWSRVVTVLIIAALSIIDFVIVYFCFEIFSRASFSSRAWDASIWHVLMTTGAGLVLYSILHPDKGDMLNTGE